MADRLTEKKEAAKKDEAYQPLWDTDHPNAVIYYGCTLGNRVEIHSGAVIGADGFGLAFAGDSWLKGRRTMPSPSSLRIF